MRMLSSCGCGSISVCVVVIDFVDVVHLVMVWMWKLVRLCGSSTSHHLDVVVCGKLAVVVLFSYEVNLF